MTVIAEFGATIENFSIKSVGSANDPEDVVELKIHASLGEVNLNELAAIRRSGVVDLRLETRQLALRVEEKLTGMPVAADTAGGEPFTPTPTGDLPPIERHYSLMLTTFPLHELKRKKVENALKKIWGVKVDEVRERTESLPANVIEKANLEFVLLAKAKLEGLGATCETVEWPVEAIVFAPPTELEAEQIAAGDEPEDGGLLATSGLGELAEPGPPALFPDAPPAPTIEELRARDEAWDGVPEDHRTADVA